MAEAARAIAGRHGRLDILLCSAGSNVRNRHWGDVDGPAFRAVIDGNLNAAFNALQAALPQFRRQKDGLAILVSSWAGRYDSYLTGPAYNAAKHGLLALGAHFNIAEAKNGLRCCTICPGEVNTPILKRRPIPVPEEDIRRMLQVDDLAATIRFVARMPAHVCVNEILISPTWNRLAMGQAAG
jgi:NAD(P)-dependent dehydrogenase (short-subunit alcohol dehydrogenase family)